eukprot:4656922-Amphidinium_carterae.1
MSVVIGLVWGAGWCSPLRVEQPWLSQGRQAVSVYGSALTILQHSVAQDPMLTRSLQEQLADLPLEDLRCAT